MGERDRSSYVFWGLLTLALLSSRLLASVVLPVYDDAFITFRYARNLAQGHGFVYQPGEWVLGTTSPLFGLLCALPHLLRLPMPGTIVVLNIFLDLFILYLTLAGLPRKDRYELGILFGALFAVSPILSRVCVGAMEEDLFLATSLVAIVLVHRRRGAAGVAVAAVACFLRPEGVLLLLILLFLVARREDVRSQARAVVASAAVLVPPLALLQWLYGSPLPQSLRAKTVLPHVRPDVGEVLRNFLAYDPLMMVCLALAAWGVVRLWRDGRFELHRTIALWSAGYVAAYALARPKIWSWYGEPVYYAEILLASIGARHALCRLPKWREWVGSPRVRRLAPLVILAPTLVWIAVLAREGPSGVSLNVFRPLARWCQAHAAERSSFLAVDIGALGYYSNGRIYDVAGLVWPDALRWRSAEEAMARSHPDYLYLNVNQRALEIVAGSPGPSPYRPIARFSPTGSADLAPVRLAPGDSWVQDYILYAGRDPGDGGGTVGAESSSAAPRGGRR